MCRGSAAFAPSPTPASRHSSVSLLRTRRPTVGLRMKSRRCSRRRASRRCSRAPSIRDGASLKRSRSVSRDQTSHRTSSGSAISTRSLRSCPGSRKRAGLAGSIFETRSSFGWPIPIRASDRRQRPLGAGSSSSDATNYIRRRRLPRAGDASMPSPQKPRSLTIAHGEIDASDKTTSLLFPSREQAPWLPFERFAETMTTSRTKLGRHPHQAEEVVINMVDGEVDHVDDSGRREALTAGSVAVLTAHEEISHDMEMLKGKRARWLSVVVRLPWHTEPPPTAVQIKTAGDAKEGSDGAVQKPVVGRLARADRKSTRLNSSHVKNSYAVFCVKKI